MNTTDPTLLYSQEAIQLFASPTGKSKTCSKSEPGSLYDCQEKARELSVNQKGDILINLKGGTYYLDKTLTLTNKDSGKNGFKIVYLAQKGEIPIICGGKKITGWVKFDEKKNIYRAKVDSSIRTRQLYINGMRASRAKNHELASSLKKNDLGFIFTDEKIKTLKKINEIEVVSFNNWKMFRMGVDSIKENQLIMSQPCWKQSLVHSGFTPNNVAWLENALEFLTDEGEWYLDQNENFLYYKPRANYQENLANAEVIAPVLEKLISGAGTSEEPIQNLSFEGITFSYATWLAPSTKNGYADIQAGTYITDSGAKLEDCEVRMTPGNILFQYSKNINFSKNTFIHLDAVALHFNTGCAENKIIGNSFSDIGSTAIQLGEFNQAKGKWKYPPDSIKEISSNNVIQNNIITTVGQEYFDACGITVFYSIGTIIEHNEIYNLPYTGISVGWGWYNGNTNTGKNKIRYNHIHHYMQKLVDGGGIYTLGAQQENEIAYNYIHHQNNEYGMLYPDEGSSHMHIHHNVTAYGVRWIHLWTESILNNKVENNFHDTGVATLNSPTSTVTNNTLVSDRKWPNEALEIINKAGLEQNYKFLLPIINMAPLSLTIPSSEYDDNYTASKVIDDNLMSGWSPSATDNIPTLTLDLQKLIIGEKIEFVTRQELDQPETRRNFEIQLSDSADFKTYKTIFARKDDSLPHQTILNLPLKNQTPFRYVRAIKTKREYFYISEIKVFGREK